MVDSEVLFIPRRRKPRKPPLDEDMILEWADKHYNRTGTWPNGGGGVIEDAPFPIKWITVENALRVGIRGLLPGSSLAVLLNERRGVRNKQALPKYTIESILSWADAHYTKRGTWPQVQSGAVDRAPGETWLAVNQALTNGGRGMPGKSSLAQLLLEHQRARKCRPLPGLTTEQILIWAEKYHQRTGNWPTRKSGDIPECMGETWGSINIALTSSSRGIGKKTSLARLLNAHVGARNRSALPELTIDQILLWADEFMAANGSYPTCNRGDIAGSKGETWSSVNSALKVGRRNLPGGSSLAQILFVNRGVKRGKGPKLP